MSELGTFLSSKELSRALGFSRTGLYSLCKRGLFPAGIRIGRSHRWQVQEVRNWLEGKQKGEIRA